jgi:hypothetical protein
MRRSRSGKERPEWTSSDYGRRAKEPGSNGRKQNKRTKDRRTTRAVANKRARPVDAVAVPLTAITPRAPHTRQRKIRCSYYGPDRTSTFPCHFFCGPCSVWDSLVTSGSVGQNKRDSARNECTAKHADPCFPTQLKRGVLKRKENTILLTIDDDSDNVSDDSSVLSRHTTTSIDSDESELQAEQPAEQQRRELDVFIANFRLEALQAEVVSLRAQLASVKSALRRERASPKNNRQKIRRPKNMNNEAYASGLSDAVIHLLSSSCRTKKDRRQTSRIFFDGLNADTRIRPALEEYGKNAMKIVFSPFAMLRLMDLNGGKLNYEAIELIRSLETEGKKYVRNTVMPSVGRLKKAAALVEKYGNFVCPYSCGVTAETGAEKVSFDPEEVIPLLMGAFGLDGLDPAAPALFAQAIDGSRFSKSIGFILYGLKPADFRAKCPFTRKSLHSPDGKNTSLQSRNYQIPLMIVIGKEDGAIYEEFRPIVSKTASLKNFKIGEEAVSSPVDAATVCSDLSATWKATGKGGACKVCTNFCSCCALTSDNVQDANPCLCERFCLPNHGEKPDWKCFHKEFLSEDVTSQQETALESILQNVVNERFKEVESWRPNCCLNNKEDPRVPTEYNIKDSKSIHYDLTECSPGDRSAYSRNVNRDLLLRGTAGNVMELRLSERQQELKNRMVEEFQFVELRDQIEHGNRGRATALFAVLNNPPCILHMHNRIALKILTTVLRHGLSNAMEGHTMDVLFPTWDPNDPNAKMPSEKKRFEAYVDLVQRVFNTQIWGSDFAPTHWNMPVDPQKRIILTLCLDNERCKAAVENIDVLLDICFRQDQDPWEYSHCFFLYRKFFVLLRKKTEFSNLEIVELQVAIDEWYQVWWRLEGRDGITNYVHLLASGHIADYLFRHRNLYVYSQQGWEAFNMLIKQVYFRRTARGGGRKSRTRLVPIARWLQRRLVFMVVENLEDLLLKIESQENKQPQATTNMEEPVENEGDDDIHNSMQMEGWL